MEIEEYREELINSINLDAEHNSTDASSQFVDWSLEKLSESEELIDPYKHQCNIEVHSGRSTKKLAFDAYGYDEADSSIVLIISDFHGKRDEKQETLKNARIDELVLMMRQFIEYTNEGKIKDYSDSSLEINSIAKDFKDKIGKSILNTQILKFKFYILTNLQLSSAVKTLTQDNLLDRPVELNVWDLERFYKLDMSKTSEIIKINCADFGLPEGIQCLKANIKDHGDYDAYLAIVPGKFLADIYLKHGSRLLEGNVRSFLTARGKINNGIRKTITSNEKRHNFFIYNNGIAVVAHNILLSEDKTHILSFEDFQIINGGQTTASLANCKVKKESNLEEIFVPMKLTVLNVAEEISQEDEDKYNEMTKEISKCANCQNPVSDADFFSTHPFHVQMEQLSQKYPAPPVDGKPYQTIWYYERSRGKWDQEQMQLTKAGREKYQKIHPKSQLVKKEKLAKCLNSILQKPYSVSAGSANNMKVFAVTIDDMWSKSQDSINEFFFKKAMASVILFDKVDNMIAKSTWYQVGGNKALVTPYTISKIISMIPAGKDIDWMMIWKRQGLYEELARMIEIVAPVADEYLADSNGKIVREYARAAQTWKDFKDGNVPAKYKISPTDEFLDSLIDIREMKDEEKKAKREHKFNSSISLEVDIFKLGKDYWMHVYNDLLKHDILSYGDCEYIKSIAGIISKLQTPTFSQCKKLQKIIKKAEDLGYIMPEE